MNKKMLVGLVAVVALIGAAVYFSGAGGDLFKGRMTLKPGATSAVTSKMLSPPPVVDCKALSAKFAKIHLDFVSKSTTDALAIANYPKLKALLSEHIKLFDAGTIKQASNCKVRDTINSQYSLMKKKLDAVAVLIKAAEEKAAKEKIAAEKAAADAKAVADAKAAADTKAVADAKAAQDAKAVADAKAAADAKAVADAKAAQDTINNFYSLRVANLSSTSVDVTAGTVGAELGKFEFDTTGSTGIIGAVKVSQFVIKYNGDGNIGDAGVSNIKATCNNYGITRDWDASTSGRLLFNVPGSLLSITNNSKVVCTVTGDVASPIKARSFTFYIDPALVNAWAGACDKASALCPAVKVTEAGTSNTVNLIGY